MTKAHQTDQGGHAQSIDSNTWKETIKRLRRRLKISASDFGVRAGLRGKNIARTVYRWESGELTPRGASQMLIQNLQKETCNQIEKV